jgi:hypothetical protein
LTLLASCDQSYLNLVIRRVRVCGLNLFRREQMHPRPSNKETSCGEYRSHLEKVPPIYVRAHQYSFGDM